MVEKLSRFLKDVELTQFPLKKSFNVFGRAIVDYSKQPWITLGNPGLLQATLDYTRQSNVTSFITLMKSIKSSNSYSNLICSWQCSRLGQNPPQLPSDVNLRPQYFRSFQQSRPKADSPIGDVRKSSRSSHFGEFCLLCSAETLQV